MTNAVAKCKCGRPARVKGRCKACYQRWWKAKRLAQGGRAALDLPPRGFRSSVTPRPQGSNPVAKPRRWLGKDVGWELLLQDLAQLVHLEEAEAKSS